MDINNLIEYAIKNATPQKLPANIYEAKKFLEEIRNKIKENGAVINIQDNAPAIITRNGFDKMLSNKAYKKSDDYLAHLIAVANVDKLYENSIHGWIEEDKNHSHGISGVHRKFAPLEINGEMRLAKLTIREITNEENLRIYSVEDIEIGDKNRLVPEMVWAKPAKEDLTLHRLHKADIEILIQEIQNYNSLNLSYSLAEDKPLLLQEFGVANYKFNKDNEMSFYVKVQDEKGTLFTIWGTGLEEAINKSNAKENDSIYLKKLGKEEVIKKVPMLDQDGLPVFDDEYNQLFEEKKVSRNLWEIKVLDKKISETISNVENENNLNQENKQENLDNNSLNLDKSNSELNNLTVQNNIPTIPSEIVNTEYQKLLESRNNFLNLIQERKLDNQEYEQFMNVNNQLQNCPELYKFAMQREIPQIIGNSGINNLEILTFKEAKNEYPDLNPQAQGFFDREKQKTVLIADMFLGKDMQQAAFVAFHELGHRGIAIEGQEKWQDWILAAYENQTIKQIADQFKIQYENHYNQLNLNETQRTIQSTEEALVEVYAAVKTDNWDLLEQRRKITIDEEFKSEKNELENIVADFEVKINEIFGVAPEKLTNENVYALLKGLDNPNPSLNINAKNDISYSLDEKNKIFIQAIDEVAKTGKTKTNITNLGSTPEAWQMIGLPNTRVDIHANTIIKSMQGSGKHFLTPATLKQIPEQLNNPVAIFKSDKNSTNPNGYVVLTELTEIEKGKQKPVIAALNVKKVGNNLEIIDISSIYGRSNSQMERALNNDLLYWDTKKGHQVANSFGLQLPTWLRTQDYDDLSKHNVKSEKDLSQYLAEKQLNNVSYSFDSARYYERNYKEVLEESIAKIRSELNKNL